MKKMKNIVVFAVAFISFISSQVFASQDSDDILYQINNSWAIGLAGLNLNYKEIESTPGFKCEHAGVAGGLTFDWRNTLFGKIYTDLYMDYYAGKLEYDGSLQVPVVKEVYPGQYIFTINRAPWKDNFDHRFFNAEGKLGFIFVANSSIQVVPYIGAGFRYWKIGEIARYNHYKAIAGMKLDCLLSDNFILSPYIEGGQIFDGHSEAYDVSHTLGKRPIYSAGFEINYALSRKLFLTGFVNYAHFEFGRSESKLIQKSVRQGNYVFNAVTINTEPSSKTNEVKVGVGFRFS